MFFLFFHSSIDRNGLYKVCFAQAEDIYWVKEELKLGLMILKDLINCT